MKFKPLATALAVAATAALALTSCSATGVEANAGERLRVVTTTTQLTDFAGQVGGDQIELTGLLAAGASAHHFDPTAADLLALGTADVLIMNGAGLDDFVDNAIEASGFSGVIIDASHGVDLELAREITSESLDGEDRQDGSNEHNHDHDDNHDHDHDHGDLNPHLWTSPRFAQGMVEIITQGLSDADPAHAELYAQRAGDFTQQLQTLDEWVSTQFARVPAADRVLVTGHDSMRYYLHDYDIAYAGSLLPSFEDQAEPSAAEIDALIDAITARKVKAIFVESSLSPKLAQTVANEASVAVIDAESLYVDSLGAAGSGAEHYIAATLHNTRVILEAWGAEIDALPENLERQ